MELSVAICRPSAVRRVLNDVAMEGMGRMMGPPIPGHGGLQTSRGTPTPPPIPGSVLQCQGHSSICSGRLTDSSNGPPYDHEILNQRPVLHVEEVEPDRLLP